MRLMSVRLALVMSTISACGGAPAAPAPSPIATPVARVEPVATRLALLDALAPAWPAAVGMDSTLPAQLDEITRVALAEGAAPGAVIAVARHGRLVHMKSYGTLGYAVGSPPTSASSLYDLASLTKVVATTMSAMILEEKGALDVQRTVASYLPEFSAPDKAAITVRMLLTHSGGLESYAPLYLHHRGRADFLAQINARPLRSIPGTATVYSDWGMVLLQAVVERIAGAPPDDSAARRIFQPLSMADTRFAPDTADATLRQRI
ncbi:MAG: beta-lactamase family protein, partial [Polaromonas sp.]|nr:beta-lactamase family protein [Gemmatimonadaceae bacterium]